MKYKNIVFVLLPLILSSCTKPTAISSEDEDKVLLLNASFVFDIAQNAEGERIATLLFDQCYYSFPNEVMIEETLVAGDQLSIVLTVITNVSAFALSRAIAI